MDWMNSLSQGFMPHGFCLRWDGPLLFVFITANLGIAIAYFAIPLALRMFIGKRKDLPYPHMFKLFAAFILSCGITHLAKIWTLYYPAYWAEAVIDAWTAGISLITAVLLYPLIPQALSLRSPQALEDANAKLEQANKDLEDVNRELAVTNENLKQARDQAVEASSLKSAFIANVSHELRTPLSGVLGMNELLMGSGLNDEQRVMAQTVQDSARTLLALVNDILDLSKIEAGKMTIETVPMHPRQIVEDVCELLMPAARNRQVSLRTEVDDEVPKKVLGDPVRTHQVLLNLLGNAVKFTTQGSIVIKARLVSTDDLRSTIRFNVIDTGIGIDDDERRNIFLPFTQADMSTTRKYGGTGLGLTISKRLVELMGGEIGYMSEKGKGSNFWFQVPYRALSKEDFGVPLEAGGGVKPALTNRVLVVEDNSMMQTVVSRQLANLGVAHVLCDTAEAALQQLEDIGAEFDMVLMDCHLPNMDGFEATRLIRAREKTRGTHIPIVAMTAGAMKGDPEKCLSAGMDDYLAKPYTLDQLRDTLNKWIQPRSFTHTSSPNKAMERPD